MLLKFKKCRDVKSPARAHATDAGIDFYVPKDYYQCVLPNKSVLIPSGIKVEIPYGYMGLFLNKSGVASKKKLLVGAQVIDTFYDGEVHINLHNIGTESIDISPDDKIIQMVLVPILSCNLVEVKDDEPLYDWMKDESVRGVSGFGSSDKK